MKERECGSWLPWLQVGRGGGQAAPTHAGPAPASCTSVLLGLTETIVTQ